MVQLANGDIMINARNNEARDKQGVGRVVATTSDLGQTWTMHPASIWGLEEPTCMTKIDDRNTGIFYEGSQADLVFERVDVSEIMK